MYRFLRSMTSVEPALRAQLRWITIAWVFGSVWMWTISGAVMTQFARGLGMPDWGFGILGAVPFVATFAQLPASWWLQRRGGRRSFFIVSLLLGRALWVVVAVLPWVLPEGAAWGWVVMLGLLAASWTVSQAGGPAWMNWMSDVVPRRVRGQYFARRNFLTKPVAVAAVLGTGWVLDRHADLGIAGLSVLELTSLMLGLAGVLGMLDILCFKYVKDPDPPQPRPESRLLASLGEPLKRPQFRVYLAYNFTLMLAIGFVGQYIWLYVLDVCGWSNLKANLLVLGLPMLAQMATIGVWGVVCDRVGKKPVLVLCSAGICLGSFGWLLIDDQRLWLGYTLILLTTMIWPGVEVANLNMLLDHAGSGSGHAKGGDGSPRKSDAGGGTSAVALNSVGTALGGSLSGVMGGLIASAWADLRWALPVVGIVLTYHGVLFLVSACLRVVAVVIATRLREPEAKGTREALQQASAMMYSNVRQAVLLPTRVTGRVLKATYKSPMQ